MVATAPITESLGDNTPEAGHAVLHITSPAQEADTGAQPFIAGDLYQQLSPQYHEQQSLGEKPLYIDFDSRYPQWQGTAAATAEKAWEVSQHIEQNNQSRLFFPEQVTSYASSENKADFITRGNGMRAKTEIGTVLRAYDKIMRTNGLREKLHDPTTSTVLSLGLGTGAADLLFIQELENKDTDTSYIALDGGIDGLQALLNFARKGYEIVVVPPGATLTQGQLAEYSIKKGYIIYAPWNFDESLPSWLAQGKIKPQIISADQSIVYAENDGSCTAREKLKTRLNAIINLLAPGGMALITELNDNCTAWQEKRSKIVEIGSLMRQSILIALAGVIANNQLPESQQGAKAAAKLVDQQIQNYKTGLRVKELLQARQVHSNIVSATIEEPANQQGLQYNKKEVNAGLINVHFLEKQAA